MFVNGYLKTVRIYIETIMCLNNKGESIYLRNIKNKFGRFVLITVNKSIYNHPNLYYNNTIINRKESRNSKMKIAKQSSSIPNSEFRIPNFDFRHESHEYV